MTDTLGGKPVRAEVKLRPTLFRFIVPAYWFRAGERVPLAAAAGRWVRCPDQEVYQ